MRRSVATAALLLLCAAGSGGAVGRHVRAQARPDVLGAALSAVEIADRLRAAPATRFRPTGTRSLVFEMRLDGPVDAWWVPETVADPAGWRHEIAAWRLADCIGMDNVPPAVPREVRSDVLRAQLDPAFADAWDDVASAIRWDDGGSARGAAVYLPRDARPSVLGRGRALERRLRRLAQDGPRPPEGVDADLAHLVLFDYLVGRPDRFGRGAPLPGSPSGQRLFALDHAQAFPARMALETLDALRRRLLRVERLAPWFAQGVARCDGRILRERLGGADPTLEPDELRSLTDRRLTVLSWIVALVDAHGEEAVLALP